MPGPGRSPVTTSSSITGGGTGSARHAIDSRQPDSRPAATNIAVGVRILIAGPPLSTILDAVRLAGRARQRTARSHANFRGYSNVVLERRREQQGFGSMGIITKLRAGFHDYCHFIQAVRPRDLDLVVRRETLAAQNQLLDLRREDIDAANDQHV